MIDQDGENENILLSANVKNKQAEMRERGVLTPIGIAVSFLTLSMKYSSDHNCVHKECSRLRITIISI